MGSRVEHDASRISEEQKQWATAEEAGKAPILPNNSSQADAILLEKPNMVWIWCRSPEGSVPGEISQDLILLGKSRQGRWAVICLCPLSCPKAWEWGSQYRLIQLCLQTFYPSIPAWGEGGAVTTYDRQTSESSCPCQSMGNLEKLFAT